MRRAFFGRAPTLVVNLGGGDVAVAQELLDLADVTPASRSRVAVVARRECCSGANRVGGPDLQLTLVGGTKLSAGPFNHLDPVAVPHEEPTATLPLGLRRDHIVANRNTVLRTIGHLHDPAG